MRQICNVAYAAQLEGMLEEEERVRWLKELWAPPGRKVSHVTAELDALMAPSMTRARGNR